VPELPEVEALASFLRERAAGRAVVRTDVASFSAVKTFDPPLSALNGAVVSGASRYG
jgi:formamidopyrimidine-DNA glycosylase